MKHIVFFASILFSLSLVSQTNVEQKLPYYEVPEYSEAFTAGTMAARMVDALGFRYFWASEGLEEKDLVYQPNEDVRSTGQTVDHILDLSYIIVNSTLKQVNGKNDISAMSFDQKRSQTLINLKTASDVLKSSEDISQFKIKFGANEIPFWNQVNGPIADAIWHCGQIASFRRSSGNPINAKVNHFMGTVKQ